jgi:hypothetical protein
MAGIGIQTAFATDSGAVQYAMVIHYNTTGMFQTPQTHILTVYEDGMEKCDNGIPLKSSLPKPIVSIKTEDDSSIAPTIKQTVSATDNPAITPYTGRCDGLQITTAANAPCSYISTWINGTEKHIISADAFAQNFAIPSSVYPSIQKSVIFNSPYNYVADYLGSTDFIVLDFLLNQTTDFNAVSTLGNTYIGDKYGLFNVSQWDPIEEEYKTADSITLPKIQPSNPIADVGTKSISTKAFGIDDALILLAIAIIVFVWYGMPQITKWITETDMAQTTQAQIEASKIVSLAAISAEYNITMSLIAGKVLFEQNIQAMINNGTLTYDQGYAMLGLVGGQYTDMINARATNIRDLAIAYYNSTSENLRNYLAGAVAVANWTDWSSNLVTLGIVIFLVIVAYYILIKRKSGSGSGGTNIFLGPKK